ncbi:transporter substrate-binding domain-containing protein [Rhizobium sp. P38BS-XIX]|uniref:transporter substrate-binding domain-containing protein n=1 Tax=Rhizobium sp. P38BS-XIX TaxID=2726740 RepID=UPI00198217AF|nr:transporter substrate-binding domain-containing protein [Rhizobium sp. P38BS-XIX]
MRNKALIFLVAAMASGLATTICGTSAAVAEDAATSIVVGADTTFPPFESEKDGAVTGFDIDMINAIAKAESMTVTVKTLPFNGLIPSLQAGSIDTAVAGITIKKSRLENANFSNAYYKSGLSVLVKKDSEIKSFDDLKGHVVATKKATSSVDYLTGHGFSADYIKQFQNIDAAYQALMTGGADAVIFDNPVNIDFKAKHADSVQTVGPLLTGEYYGIAISKTKPDLVNKINDGLEKIKKSGEYHQLFVKYFGGDTSGEVNEALDPAKAALPE